MKNKEDLNKLLLKRILALLLLSGVSLVAMLRFAPKIGSIFGMISVNRNEEFRPPEANLPPPVFVKVPEATNETKINLQGLSTPKTKIDLYVNGPLKESVLTDMSGEFLFTDVKLNKGKNTIFAKAGDTQSEVITIQYDDEKPEITIESPKEDERIENLNERIEITGEINEKAEILINERKAIQRPDNSFTFLLGVDEGEVEIKIEVTDLAGNKEEKEFKVYYQKE